MANTNKKNPLLVVTYLDDLYEKGCTPVNFNQRSFNPTPKFQGLSVDQGKDQQKSAEAILKAAQAAVGAEMSLALGYVDQGLTQTTTFVYDKARFINEKVELEALPGYGKFWVMKEKQPQQPTT